MKVVYGVTLVIIMIVSSLLTIAGLFDNNIELAKISFPILITAIIGIAFGETED